METISEEQNDAEKDFGEVKTEEEEELERTVLSKKKRKLLNRMTIAQLKQQVKHPEVVELHDANSNEALLLVHLKSYRNTVPVPRHWIQKRKYLANKVGIEKSLYRLPDYIEATGVSKMRDALAEAEAKKSRKQKQREKVRPKMGKVSMDWKMLHDAFFVYQTKPEHLTIHGDIYYEGKENQINASKYKPGVMSAELKQALGMGPGMPPPWLYNMQRYGPPPSYPNLKVPGVNAPIPARLGAQYGMQPGGWGTPPTDEDGHPIYGNPYDIEEEEEEKQELRKHWGSFEEDEEDEEEEEEEGEDEEMEEEIMESI
eukprot:MONOS_4106.1-p1 / transcript=MONOS_4106.1 / gene=MONOS_4106 / organism=Monocercomonoides_exilis_PA203 / gene_product=splicing factor 3B subunit 2 / transcript_product=splicing factor 3B subunit 2 / location=Mono_scaffold00104:117717-118884(+) / protein_length=314 / sequence_SO=supercontig / SO=protein_coding / is_pseudo=false